MTTYRYEALEAFLRQQIQLGRYRQGDKLPSVRSLCDSHSLSKATVLHALHRLEADQLVQAQPKSGYFVLPPPKVMAKPSKVSTPDQPALVTVPDLLRDIMSRSAAFDLLPSEGPGPASSHLITLHRFVSRAARSHPELKASYYDEPQGLPSLRTAISELYRQRNTMLPAEAICITSGCQHALFLALMACCKAGDTVAVESPTFYGVLQLLEQLGLNVIEIATDPVTGMDVDDLALKLAQWPVKACVVTPNFSTPTGAKMPLPRQSALLALAKQHDFYVIEDDIYGELGFQSDYCSPLKSLPNSERVILCGSFSKNLSRDLRIGWIAAGALHAKVVQLKLITQLASPQSTQEGLAQFINDGHFKRHANQLSQQLKDQRDSLLETLKRHWSDDILFTKPDGGLSCWVQLPDSVNTQASYSALLEKGIVITPGVLFSANGLYQNHLRLSFSQPLTERRLQALHQVFQALLS